jgi:AmmeMemoRadiSam system protein B
MERAPVVAGRFYPDDPEELQAEILKLLAAEGSVTSQPAVAAIAPHGALAASGSVSAAVFARVQIPSVVVLLCASHTGQATRGSIMHHGTWRLPGGGVPIDTRFAEELRSLALLTEDPDAHRHEHAIEVHLPFLLRRNPRVRIVPVAFGPLPAATCVRIGNALADVMNGHSRDVLALASTNLAHYLPVDALAERDERVLDRIRALDVEGLFQLSEGPEIGRSAASVPANDAGATSAIDGLVPTAIVMSAARALGAMSAEVVARDDSSTASGDRERAVGYAGVVIR